MVIKGWVSSPISPNFWGAQHPPRASRGQTLESHVFLASPPRSRLQPGGGLGCTVLSPARARRPGLFGHVTGMPRHTCRGAARGRARPRSCRRAASGSRSPRVRCAHARSSRFPARRPTARTELEPPSRSGDSPQPSQAAIGRPAPPRRPRLSRRANGRGQGHVARRDTPGGAAQSWAPGCPRAKRTCCAAGPHPQGGWW